MNSQFPEIPCREEVPVAELVAKTTAVGIGKRLTALKCVN